MLPCPATLRHDVRHREGDVCPRVAGTAGLLSILAAML